MALTAVHVNPPADAYLGGLRAAIASISPALLNRDRWGFLTLREAFAIDETSRLYSGASPNAVANRIVDSGASDDFLGGIGYDFGAVPEPYRTELKAFFAWRLTRPQHRAREQHRRMVRLIAFCRHLATTTAQNALPLLIDYGHPIESGAGNGSSPLRDVMEPWLASGGWSTATIAPPSITRAADGSRVIIRKDYRGISSMPANELTFILVLLRERMKPLERRNLLLLRDLYPEDEIAENPRRESYIHFYGFRLDWLRDAARLFVLSKIAHRELRATSLPGYLARLMLLEACLRETHTAPRIEHITQTFIGETFLNWGNARKLTGKNWYADVCNLVRYASSHLADRGWPGLMLDKRDLRRVEGMWPGGRGYQLKVTERTIPEDVMERMFQKLDSLDAVLKRLLVLGRYTGMRSADLHALDFDCLKEDPDDPRFMILTFYQSKVQRWNTKPLLKEDAAHALVIMTIREQQAEVRRQWERETKYLFPMRTGDGETPLTGNYTRDAIKKWMLTEDIRTKNGTPWEFGWHGLRHFHGTELALQGHDIALIQMELSRRKAATVATPGDTSGLRAAAEEKRIRKRRAVEDAIQDMRHAGEAITFKTIAEKAGVSREYLYQNFKADIEQLRTATQSRRIEVDGDPVPVRTARRSATIEAALRNKIKRLEEEATELRKQKTALERRYEKALGEAEEWRQRHQRALAELLELRGRLARNDG